MATNDRSFMELIVKFPNDANVRKIYADWLED